MNARYIEVKKDGTKRNAYPRGINFVCGPLTRMNKVTRKIICIEILLVITVSCAAGAARIVRAAVAEVGVHAGLLRRESVRGVVLEQGLQELQTSLFEAGDNGDIGALPLGESRLVIGEGGNTRPNLFIGSTEDTAEKNISG